MWTCIVSFFPAENCAELIQNSKIYSLDITFEEKQMLLSCAKEKKKQRIIEWVSFWTTTIPRPNVMRFSFVMNDKYLIHAFASVINHNIAIMLHVFVIESRRRSEIKINTQHHKKNLVWTQRIREKNEKSERRATHKQHFYGYS